jgi:hypothetical protein
MFIAYLEVCKLVLEIFGFRTHSPLSTHVVWRKVLCARERQCLRRRFQERRGLCQGHRRIFVTQAPANKNVMFISWQLKDVILDVLDKARVVMSLCCT